MIWPAYAKAYTDCGDTITNTIILNENLTCSGNGLIAGAGNITIDCRGKTLQGDGTGKGIKVEGFDRVTITNCNIVGFDDGIYLRKSIDNTIIDVSLSNSTRTGLYLSRSSGNSFESIYSTGNTENGMSITVESNGNEVRNSNFNENSYHGIRIFESNGNSIHDNKMQGNENNGIEVFFSSGNFLNANDITDSGTNGIRLWNANDNEIVGNNGHNIGLNGISVGRHSTGNSIKENNFYNTGTKMQKAQWYNTLIDSIVSIHSWSQDNEIEMYVMSEGDDAFGYAVCSGGDIKFTGSGTTNLNGGSMHTNREFKMTGSNTLKGNLFSSLLIQSTGSSVIDGDATAPLFRGKSPGNVTGNVTKANVPEVEIPEIDLSPYYNEALANNEIYGSSQHFSGSDDLEPVGGIMWINGDLQISGSGDMIGSFIATGNIKISGSRNQIKVADYPALVSLNGDIEISGSGSFHGLIYAKNGEFKKTGSSQVVGSVITGGKFTKTGGSDMFLYEYSKPMPPGSEYQDYEFRLSQSTSGNTVSGPIATGNASLIGIDLGTGNTVVESIANALSKFFDNLLALLGFE